MKLQIKKRGMGEQDANWINVKMMNPDLNNKVDH
jgi:hypothetical protein